MPTFLMGKDAELRWTQSGKPALCLARTIEIAENADDIADDVNGEDRSRLQIVTNFYTVSLDTFLPTLEPLDTFLEDTANVDARVTELQKVIGVRFRLHDGTRVAYTLTEVTRSPFQLSIGGRRDRSMIKYSLRARYLKKVKSV